MQSRRTLCFAIALLYFAKAQAEAVNQPLTVTYDQTELCIWMQLPSATDAAKSWMLYTGAPEKSRAVAQGSLADKPSDKVITFPLQVGASKVFVLRFFDAQGEPSSTHIHQIASNVQHSEPILDSVAEKLVLLFVGSLLTLFGGVATIRLKQGLDRRQARESKHDELRTSVIELAALVFSPEMLSEVNTVELQELIKKTAALSYYDKRVNSLQLLLVDLLTLHSGADFVNDHGRFQAQYLDARAQWSEALSNWV